jgi:small subunit ribosomal protein S18
MRETRSTTTKGGADKEGRDGERSGGRFRRKKNPLAEAKITEVTFKDVTLLKYFVSERGRILPRRMTGVSSKQQRMLAKAIKQARGLALLPTLKHD